MPMDEQHLTDVEQARKKLQEVQETRDARKDPRSQETSLLPPTPRSLPEEAQDRGIRPVAAKPQKKKFGRRLKEALFGDDIGNGSITEYAFFQMIVPAFKRTVCETLNTMINMAFGLDPRTRTIGGGSVNTHTANASLYRDRNFNRPSSSPIRRIAVSEYEWDEETAKDIYSQIQYQIDQFGQCRLDLLYSIMGLGTEIRTTDRHWGWTSMNGITIRPIDARYERWIVDMPPVKQID